jgi:enoyl-CoA hydratase/carnithine racemase
MTAGTTESTTEHDVGTPLVRALSHGSWGQLVLANPGRRNALVPEIAAGLAAGLERLEADGCAALVVRGEGATFCAGLDLAMVAEGVPPAMRERWADLHRRLYRTGIVTIAALEGWAVNAGAALVLACDLCIAGRGARLRIAEVAMGMRAPMNVAWLRLRTSESVAASLLLTGRDADGPELARLGLATEVVDDDGVVDRAHGLAQQIAAMPAGAPARMKHDLRAATRAAPGAFFDHDDGEGQ